MAGKGERTRSMVLERAARLFNERGYHAASISDVLRETGLEKGGLYNHFGSKDALALEAFDYAVGLIEERFSKAVQSNRPAPARLRALVEAFTTVATNPPVPGGCPVLNTAVHAADTHPALLARARDASTRFQRLVGSLVKEAVRSGEMRPQADPRRVASVVTGSLEGALMLCRLYGDDTHMRYARAHLYDYLDSLRND